MTGYAIGKIEGNIGTRTENLQKFLINERQGNLEYYAKTIDAHTDLPEHQDIAEEFGLENVLGGGYACAEDRRFLRFFSKTYLKLYSESSRFGGVPASVLRKFKRKLLKEYRNLNQNIDGIIIETISSKGFAKWEGYI